MRNGTRRRVVSFSFVWLWRVSGKKKENEGEKRLLPPFGTELRIERKENFEVNINIKYIFSFILLKVCNYLLIF